MRGSSHGSVEATRSVVLGSGVEQLGFWSNLLTGPGADHDTLVALRRQDLPSLRDWTQRHSLCAAAERLTLPAGATGGRPYLLDTALQLSDLRPDRNRVLADLTSWRERSSGAEQFVDAVGLLENDTLKAAYDGVSEQLGTDAHEDAYLVTAAEMAGLSSREARGAAVVCLDALQVFDRDGSSLASAIFWHACGFHVFMAGSPSRCGAWGRCASGIRLRRPGRRRAGGRR
ncbi:hypothetical protein AB0P07_34905 [Streptomyces sp. NPDC085944]|uniref:hypothetical protein n=1 Tax=Streptomyces sp. NPDC085944 TaxID=3154962 RepID=UPI00342244F8